MDTSSAGVISLDDEWLVAAQGGDQAAFARLYSSHVRAVYWSARRLLGSDIEAEDVTQQVFILAWRKRASISIVDRSILPWLLVTCRNVGLNRLKQQGRERAHTADFDLAEIQATTDSDAEYSNRLLGEAIDDAVADLSETDQTLYYLCIEEGLSYQDAAAALGTSISGVRNRLFRVRKSLRVILATQREGLL